MPYFLLLIICLILSACTNQTPTIDTEIAAENTEQNIYHNDYLGLSITIPEGWHINMLSDNLSSEPIAQEYQPGRLELLDINNNQPEHNLSHCRFYAYAEIFPEQIDINNYIDIFRQYLTGENSQIIKEEEIPLLRQNAHRLIVNIELTEQDLHYHEEYYILPIKDAVLVFYLNYWPNQEDAAFKAQKIFDYIDLTN